MMKMSRSCCVALIFVLTSVSAVQRLRSINALKKIHFGQSVPMHSLILLHWFANTVHIDNNNVIWLTFDPDRGDYGSHHYGNYEGLLDPLLNGYWYYTIGNLYQETSQPLPPYVARPTTEYEERNLDRIIIRVREHNIGQRAWQRIDQVYLTQHYDTSEHQGTPYDPAHTYRISTRLLRQIREFSVGQNQQRLLQLRNRYGGNADVSHIRNTWGDLAALGLLLFIVIQERSSTNQRNNRPENRRTHLDDGPSKSESNDSRDRLTREEIRIDIPDNEVRNARWMTGNRGSGSYYISIGLNNILGPYCYISCFAFLCLMLLCTILLFLYIVQDWYLGPG